MIRFSDPIWNRLYGPYGVRPPQAELAALAQNWDTQQAWQLFWDELHHQDSLYPVTYAALPWIWETFPLDDPEVKSFLAHVVAVAIDPDLTGDSKYNGLSLNTADHHKTWLAEDEWLTDDDMAVLAEQQEWMDSHIANLAQAGLDGIADADLETAPYLIEGYLALNGAWTVRLASQMISDGFEPDEMREELELDSPEAQAKFRRDIELVAPLHPELYERLRTIVPDP